MAALTFGFALGSSNPSHERIKEFTKLYNYNTTPETESWIASLVPLGATIGIIPWSYCNTKFGPKKTMLVHSPCTILVWLSLAFLNKINTYLTGRFFCGFFSISYIVNGEALLADAVHRENLKHMLVFFRSSVWIGVYCTYKMGFLYEERYIGIACISVICVHTVLLLVNPESPVFLYGKNPRLSERALKWYRGNNDINTEMRKIKNNLELRRIDPAATSGMIYASVVTKGIRVVVWLMFFQAFTGYFVFIFYNISLWHKQDKMLGPETEATTFIFFLCLFNFIGVWIHYRVPFGVRKPLIISTLFVAISLTALTTDLYLRHFERRNFDLVPLLITVIFIFSYEMGLSTYPSIILHEYMPYQVYYRAKNFTLVVYWFFVFILVKMFVTVKEAATDYIAFGILTAITYIGVVYMYIFVVETKGKSLIQVQTDLGGNPIGNRGSYGERTHIAQ